MSEAKRHAVNAPLATPTSSSGSALVDPVLQSQLASIGPRVRKQVSDGHLTPGTSLPSLQGNVVGSLNPQTIEAQWQAARPFHSTTTVERGIKRTVDKDDDEYGDTEDDEPSVPSRPVGVSQRSKTYFVPAGHRTSSTPHDDFEEAAFLKPL